MALVQLGTNTKLGDGIGAVSLPPLTTCPGKTEYCSKVCYATKGFFRMSNVQKSLAANYATTESDDFINQVNAQIKKQKLKALRIHPAGDLYSNEYIDKWITIVKDNPNVRFWVYTRSWRLASLTKKLQQLQSLPNIEVFASTDDTTAETPPNWLRVAAVSPSWDGYDQSYVKCPNQKNKTITCEKCTYCFKPSGQKTNVVFKEH